MKSKDFNDRIDEVTEHEGRRNAESSMANSSTPKPSSSAKFGFGKKCLIVFAAALVASAIVHALPGASTYTELDKAFGVDPKLQATMLAQVTSILGGATAFFLMAMVIAAFVRGSTGAITGVVLVGVWAYFSIYGRLHNREVGRHGGVAIDTQEKLTNVRPAPALTPPDRKQSAKSFFWKPTGSEYSVVFADTPTISEARGVGDSGEVTVLQAMYSGGVGFERAQFVPISTSLRERVTKETENTAIANWARANGIEHYQVEFDDSNTHHMITTFKAAKPISTNDGEVIMSFVGERHWGQHSMISLVICAPASKSPTSEGMAFLQSIRLEK